MFSTYWTLAYQSNETLKELYKSHQDFKRDDRYKSGDDTLEVINLINNTTLFNQKLFLVYEYRNRVNW